MFTLVAVGATPARVSRSDMGMPVKRMSFFTKGSKIVAVLVVAVAPAELLGVLEPHPASAAASTATPITAYAVRFMTPPAPRSNGSGLPGRCRSDREPRGGTE